MEILLQFIHVSMMRIIIKLKKNIILKNLMTQKFTNLTFKFLFKMKIYSLEK